MSANVSTIDQLAFALEQAKEAEALAKAARLEAEEALLSAVGVPEEGTQRTDGQWYRVTAAQTLARSFDPEAEIPYDLLRQVTRVKSELDVVALKRLATSDPAAYAIVARGIVTKPAKPTVKVERLQEQK